MSLERGAFTTLIKERAYLMPNVATPGRLSIKNISSFLFCREEMVVDFRRMAEGSEEL